MSDIAAGEAAAKAEATNKTKRPLTASEIREKAAREENEGLLDMASRDLFEVWYIMGGYQSPPTLAELYQLPAWLVQDIRYIFLQLGEERDRLRTQDANRAALSELKKAVRDHTPTTNS